jgi:hypothetical protein
MKKKIICFFILLQTNLICYADEFTNIVPTTNSVFITSNLIFYLADMNISGRPALKLKSDVEISRVFVGVDTNYVFFRVFPYEQTFEFRMTDEKGQAVQKTAKGLMMSKPAILPKNRLEVPESNGKIVNKDIADARLFFRPDEMFLITNKGIYDLEVWARVYVPATNGVLDISSMTNSYRFLTSKHFGVLTSPPLHMKVIKE